MDKVKRIEEGRQAELAPIGLTDGDYRSCFRGEPCSGTLAMTDGSKRRLDENPTDDPENDIAQGYVLPLMPRDPFPASESHAMVEKFPVFLLEFPLLKIGVRIKWLLASSKGRRSTAKSWLRRVMR
jgi:hypothetical protein